MDKKIKSIKIILLVFGSLVIFSNSMGLLVNSMMSSPDINKPVSGMNLLIANFNLICLIAIIIGVLCLTGSILLDPKKSWTRIFVIFISIASIICTIGFSIIMFNVLRKEGLGLGLGLAFLISGLVFSTPFVVLIIHLNKIEVKENFT